MTTRFVILLLTALLPGCMEKRSVTVYLTAAAAMKGADVRLDGKVVGRLEDTPPERKQRDDPNVCLAVIEVPIGKHTISVFSNGKEIAFERIYSRPGEDYIEVPLTAPVR